jgi:prolyl 4-hydroxylase
MLTIEQGLALNKAHEMFAYGFFNETKTLVLPLVKLQIPEALLLNAKVLIQTQPSDGLSYLLALAENKITGACYNLAFLLYFNPQINLSFQDYLFRAYQQGDVNSVIVAANLYYQQNDKAKAFSLLMLHKHMEDVASILQSLNTNHEIVSIENFDDLTRPDLSTLHFQLIASEINLYTVDDFINDFESTWLIERAKDIIERSSVVDKDTGDKKVSEIRTGHAAQLHSRVEDWVLLNVEMKIAAYFNLPIENGEVTNILHYGINEEYKPHYDFFLAQDKGSAQALLDGGQRFKTVLIYLNDVEKGGETNFPRLQKKIIPKKNQLIVFNNTDNSYRPLPQSLHQGLPIIVGDKWLFSKWIRQNATSYSDTLRKLNINR